MQASFLFCVAATIAFSQFLSVFGSSEFKLHNQHTGYFLESKSRTKIFTKRSNKIERKSGACLQDRQSKNINCQVINDDKAYIAFEFPQNLLGYQEFDILQYGDTTTGHSAAAESELLTMSNLTYYIIQQEEAEIAGVMDITVPPYGSIISNELYIEVDYHNVAHTSNFKTVARQEGLQFHFKVLGVTEGLYPGELRHLKSTNIEPGSWFYSVTPVQARQQNPSNKANQHYNDAELKRGYPSYGYIEFIMSEENIVRQRRYRDQYELNNEYSVGAASKHFLKARSMIDKPIAVQPGSEPQATLLGAGDKVNICIWSSNTMDGQKRIWLQQIEHLDTAQFRFTWMLTLTEGLTIADESARLGALKRQGLEEPTSMFTTVRRLFVERGNGGIMDSPFNGIALDVEDLLADPGDGRRPAAEIWAGDELELYRLVRVHRLS